jgi:hypothetical protein
MTKNLETLSTSGKGCTAHLDKLETAYEKNEKTIHFTKREKQLPIYKKVAALHLKFPENYYFEYLLHCGEENGFTTSQIQEISKEFGIHFRTGNKYKPHLTKLK